MNKEQLIKLANEKLNKLELSIFRLMLPQAGVVFLKGRPGTAKSAVLESIANKLNMVYIRMDLTAKDEVDIGLYPYLQQTDKGYSKVSHAVPDWAEMTLDDRMYLIVFEEINRAKKDIMNAALGLLNERRVGHNFKFKENVFMAAAGNMGEADGTDVEELDVAQSSRLISFRWEMDLMTWKQMFADENIHPDILKFLEHKPTSFHPQPKEQTDDVHVCPRTWTNLSKLIVTFFGKDSNIDDYGELLRTEGKFHVGVHAQQMFSYLNDSKRLTVKNLLAGKYKNLDAYPRDNRQEVARELQVINLLTLKEKELANVKKLLLSFKTTQDEDALIGTMYEMIFNVSRLDISQQDNEKYEPYRAILKKLFKPDFERELGIVSKKIEELDTDKKV